MAETFYLLSNIIFKKYPSKLWLYELIKFVENTHKKQIILDLLLKFINAVMTDTSQRTYSVLR